MAKTATQAMPGEKNFLQTFGEAFAKGDIFTKVSFLVWGLGYIGHGQLMKALLVTLVEGLGLYFLAFYGAPNLAKFGTLGTVKMEMVFDVTTMKNVVNNYDNSFEILLMSMISFVVIAALIAAAMMVVTSNYQLQKIRAAGKKTNNFLQDINVYLNEKFYVTLLTLPVLGVVVFTIVPLFILIAVAFTNYDQQHMPPNDLFTWVGLTNFFTLFGGGGMTSTFGYSFAKVLTWTLVWAFFATFTNFFGGILLAMFINDKKPVSGNMFTEKYGTHQCLLAVRENVMRAHHTTVDEAIINRVFRFGTAEIKEDYLKTITDTATDYVEGIFQRLREHEYNPELMRLYVLGGGSCLIRNFGVYDASRVTINDDICATAKGYEYLAQLSFRRGTPQ